MYGVSMFHRRASFFLCMGVSMFPQCASFSYVKEFQCFPGVRPSSLCKGVSMFPQCASFFFMYRVSMFHRRASFFLCIGVSMFPRCAPFLMLGVLMFHRCAPFSLRASGSRTHYVRVFLNHIRSHRGYCTLCDAYVFWPGGVKSRLEIQHLNRRQRCLFSLVPMLAAGAVFGLLDVVGGAHAEDHRFARD